MILFILLLIIPCALVNAVTYKTLPELRRLDRVISLNQSGNNFTANCANFGNDTLYVDCVNNRVGIGTASPAATMDIRGNLHTRGINTFYNAGGTQSMTITSNNIMTNVPFSWSLANPLGFSLTVDLDAGDFFSISSQANLRELLDTNGRQAWVKIRPAIRQTSTAAYDALYIDVTEASIGDGSTGDGNNLFNAAIEGVSKFVIDRTGNVGIGTTNPQAKLHVNGSIMIEDNLIIGGDILVVNKTQLNINESITLSNKTGGVTIVLNASGDSWFIGGNVGIGTGSPSEELYVVGTIYVEGGTSNVSLGGTTIDFDRAGPSYIRASDVIGSLKLDTGGSNTRLIIDSAGNFDINSGKMVIKESTGNIGIGTTTPSYLLQTEKKTGGADVNLSDTLYVNSTSGNVGIGTAKPDEPLTVETSLHGYGMALRQTTVGAGLYTTWYDANNKHITMSLFDENFSDPTFADSFIFGVRYNKSIQFATTPTSNLEDGEINIYLSNNGNVGIGNTTPIHKLVVNGNITAENVFLPQSIFSHTNETIPLLGASVWTNISFDQEDADLKRGIEHDIAVLNHTFTITQPGEYYFHYDYDVEDISVSSSEIDVAGRAIYANGTEIIGSVHETGIQKRGVETDLTYPFNAYLNAGDVIVFQFIATNANVHISTHGTFGEHPESAAVIIRKEANLPE